MTDLWCVHIIGPDDLIPAPDRGTAERWADKANEYINQKLAENPDFADPRIEAEVILWPYTPEGHAEGVSEEYRWITQ